MGIRHLWIEHLQIEPGVIRRVLRSANKNVVCQFLEATFSWVRGLFHEKQAYRREDYYREWARDYPMRWLL
jgi:hypothetical protein